MKEDVLLQLALVKQYAHHVRFSCVSKVMKTPVTELAAPAKETEALADHVEVADE